MIGRWASIALLGALAASQAGSPARVEPARRPDIVLVVLDTVRRDATGVAGPSPAAPAWPKAPGGLTPNLDAFAARSAVFTNAFSPSPWTAPAHASLFTGLLPSEHLCGAGRPKLDPAIPTLAELLAKAGYETAAFYSNPWLSDEATGLLRGFQRKVASPIGNLRQMTSADGDQGGGASVRNATEWLRTRKPGAPFFLFVNLLEAHLPYDPPQRIRQAFTPPLPAGAASIDWAHEYNAGLRRADTDWERNRALYAGDVRFVDELLGRLLDALRAAGALDRAAVVVTSDHGENLGEHGLAEHQFSVHETLLAVPLVVRLPGRTLPPGRSAAPVMTSDLFATLAESAGIPLDKPPRFSTSLTRAVGGGERERPLFAEDARPHRQLLALLHELNPARDFSPLDQAWRTVRVGSLRLTIGGAGSLALHDLATDPRQEKDLAPARADTVARLGAIINTLPAAATAAGADAAPDGTLDEETRRRLRTLGYLD